MRSLVIPAFALWLFSLSSKASSVMFDFIEMFFSLQNFLCCSVNAFIEMFIIGDLVSVYTSSTTSWTIFWAKFRWIVPKMCKLNRDYSEISYGPSQWSSLFQSSQNISGLVGCRDVMSYQCTNPNESEASCRQEIGTYPAYWHLSGIYNRKE